MKSIFSRVMAVVALSMSLGFAAGTANAVPLTFTGWDLSSPGEASTFFKRTGISTATFADWLNFSLPAGSTGVGESSVAAVKVSTGTITKFELWETNSTFTSLLSMVGAGSTGAYASSLIFSGGSVPGYYKLLVEGKSATAYAGTITTPVPEPETYAMLLAGLGLLGLSTRRRNSSV